MGPQRLECETISLVTYFILRMRDYFTEQTVLHKEKTGDSIKDRKRQYPPLYLKEITHLPESWGKGRGNKYRIHRSSDSSHLLISWGK